LRFGYAFASLRPSAKPLTKEKCLLLNCTKKGKPSQQAESKADFIHKLSVALKEANETDYWINLLFNSGYMERENYYAISADINEILRLLTSIIKTSKQNR